MQKKTFYFKHDFHARLDMKIIKMVEYFGSWECYGIFWCIIEILSTTKGHVFKLSEISLLSSMLNVSVQKLKEILTMFDLFVIDQDNGIFYSESLMERMAEFNHRIDKSKESALARWENERRKKLGLPPLPKGANNFLRTDLKLSKSSYNTENIETPILIVESKEIKLPPLSFDISRASETSWKSCLLICNKSYAEIQTIYYSTPEDIFKSYINFNIRIDDPESDIDLRTIRIAHIQVDLHSYQKLYNKYPDRTLIKDALIKLVNAGVKQEHSIYNRLLQYIPYVEEERKSPQKINGNQKLTIQPGKQLIDGFYYINGQKMLNIDINDMEQCRQLIKRIHGESLNDDQIKSLRMQKGDEAFKWWLE